MKGGLIICASMSSSVMAVLPLEPVLPPAAFGIVEQGIYRCNAFHPDNFAFMRRISLKSILYLSSELTRLKDFIDQTNVRFCNQGLKAWRPDVTWKPVSDELVKDSLEFILNKENHPVMIMCSSGVHETGILVGCLRRLQFWNMAAIIDEHRRFAGTKSRFVNEQFIELFDIDLVNLPQLLPDWFMAQIKFFDSNARASKSRSSIETDRSRTASDVNSESSMAIAEARNRTLRASTYGPLVSSLVTYDPIQSTVIEDD